MTVFPFCSSQDIPKLCSSAKSLKILSFSIASKSGCHKTRFSSHATFFLFLSLLLPLQSQPDATTYYGQLIISPLPPRPPSPPSLPSLRLSAPPEPAAVCRAAPEGKKRKLWALVGEGAAGSQHCCLSSRSCLSWRQKTNK